MVKRPLQCLLNICISWHIENVWSPLLQTIWRLPVVRLIPADLQVLSIELFHGQIRTASPLSLIAVQQPTLRVSAGAEETIALAVMRRQIVQHLLPSSNISSIQRPLWSWPIDSRNASRPTRHNDMTYQRRSPGPISWLGNDDSIQ